MVRRRLAFDTCDEDKQKDNNGAQTGVVGENPVEDSVVGDDGKEAHHGVVSEYPQPCHSSCNLGKSVQDGVDSGSVSKYYLVM